MLTEQAANTAKTKFDQIIKKGSGEAVNLLTQLERNIPEDRLISTDTLQFEPNCHEGREYEVMLTTPSGDRGAKLELSLHSNALSQMITKSQAVGATTARKLLDFKEDWATDTLTTLLNSVYHNIKRERVLIRSIDGEARGFLSDRYRRLDSGPIFEAFAKETQKFEAVPTHASFMDTKTALTMHLPEIFEPFPNEPLLAGVTLSNSDYGNGALSLKFSLMRMWCSNLAIRDEAFRKVHLGAKLPEEVQFSEKTYQLDATTITSAITDLVGNYLNPEFIKGEMKVIEEASTKEVNIETLLTNLRKNNKINKGEEVAIAKKFNTPEIELLPPGVNLWRASNAISLFAGNLGNTERSFELQQLAGNILN